MKKFIFYLMLGIGTIHSQTNVTFYTTMGNFDVEIYDNIKPITGGNFLTLVNNEFYDGIILHRVINNFIVQGGDPTGTGFGGPGYTIPDEFNSLLSNIQKTISMANAGPNTGGSQFFFNMVDNTHLDFDPSNPFQNAYPVFGKVLNGWNVLLNIQNVPVNASYRPNTPIVMDSIRLQSTALINEYKKDSFTTTIYPNPVTKESYIKLKNVDSNFAKITILSMNGLVIENKKISIQQKTSKISMSNFGINKLPAGVYIMVINTGNKSVKEFFIVKE